MNILIVSNGHGEDTIAATLAEELQSQVPHCQITVFPLVGSGSAYSRCNLTPTNHNPSFPSGGFIRNLKDLIGDLRAGLYSHLITQHNQLKRLGKKHNLILCVGDVFCLLMGFSRTTKTIFFPTAKSDSFMPHSALEQFFIKRWAIHSFPRDQRTTEAFTRANLSASFHGNPMFDNLQTQETLFNSASPTIGLLPGSRNEGLLNCLHCMAVSIELHKKEGITQFACAWPNSLDLTKLCQKSNWVSEKHPHGNLLKHPDSNTEILFTSKFLSVINHSDIIIGLAGTANEQAMFLNKTVIAFEGFGPQSSKLRFEEQKKLMNNALIICKNNHIESITNTVTNTLKSQKKTPPPPQQKAAKKIIQSLITHTRNT